MVLLAEHNLVLLVVRVAKQLMYHVPFVVLVVVLMTVLVPFVAQVVQILSLRQMHK
jgi:hypothetical protein